MAEPISPSVIIPAVTGITIVGVTTGLQPDLLIAGAAGGWWAMSYQESMPPLKRVSRIILSALVAAWSAPLAASFLDLPGRMHMVQLPVAMAIGLATIDVLGRGVLSIVQRFMDRKGGQQ